MPEFHWSRSTARRRAVLRDRRLCTRLQWYIRRTKLAVIPATILWTACSREPIDSANRERAAENGVHQALRAKNPSYNGQGQFELLPGGLRAVLRESGITDVSPLKKMALSELDLQNNAISDLGPLEGMQLEALYLEGTQVSDLRPLRGMPLRILYLSATKVIDLAPLKGMPLRELNLLGTGVTDLGPLYGAPLEILWLNETSVHELRALEASPLLSLTIHRTRVENLAPLSRLRTLQRLHIAETPVTDLTPLEGLELVRLIFSPGRIRKGIGIARRMRSLRELGTSLENRVPPSTFWEMYDKGEFR